VSQFSEKQYFTNTDILMNILLVYGKGGGEARFTSVLEVATIQSVQQHTFFVPELSGYEGRDLTSFDDIWGVLIEDLYRIVENKTTEPWVFYGHGTGASLLLEFADRDYTFASGHILKPRKCILHSPSGLPIQRSKTSNFSYNFFINTLVKKAPNSPFVQKWIGKHLFLEMNSLSESVRTAFFEDYKNNVLLENYTELFLDTWYERTKKHVWFHNFRFIWGSEELAVKSRHYEAWKKDYPRSIFRVVEGWGKYPMLEKPSAFLSVLLEEIAAK
jgi:pimeloyl-ACP methyl ester carboxylesterase